MSPLKRFRDHECLRLADAPKLKKNNAATLVLAVEASALIKKGSFYSLSCSLLKERRFPGSISLCTDFPYRNTPSSYSLGSGFFIRQDVIATAASVLFPPEQQIELENIRFIRGLFKDEDLKKIKPAQIFQPVVKALNAQQYRISRSGPDWAIVPVEPLVPEGIDQVVSVKCNAQGSEVNAPVYAIGHGLGLPIHIAKSEVDIQVNDINQPYFSCHLPVFTCSPGAPVFHARTHELIGMYIRGGNPFSISDDGIGLYDHAGRLPDEQCQRLRPMLDALELMD